MSYRFARCRTLGHAWHSSGLVRDDDDTYALNLTCLHCGTSRTDRVGPQGSLIRRGYRYISEYDHAAQNRSAWRADFLAQLWKNRKPS